MSRRQPRRNPRRPTPDRVAAGAQRAMQAMLGVVKLDIEGLRRAYEGKSAA
jgi:hypothetical protein